MESEVWDLNFGVITGWYLAIGISTIYQLGQDSKGDAKWNTMRIRVRPSSISYRFFLQNVHLNWGKYLSICSILQFWMELVQTRTVSIELFLVPFLSVTKTRGPVRGTAYRARPACFYVLSRESHLLKIKWLVFEGLMNIYIENMIM
mgnify:CR=1 FL=1